jgi:hypothetical protein
MPKTGTSALQLFFIINIDRLYKYGINYPKFNTPEIGNATSLVGPLIPNGPKLNCQAYTLSMLEDFLSKEKNNVLLSSEWFITLGYDNLKIFKEIFSKYSFCPVVICYIRRRDKELQSVYTQAFKYRKIDCKCDELVVHQNYIKTLNKFTAVFDTEAIRVRCYEKKQFYNGNIFYDFLNILGIDNFKGFTIPENKINASPPKYFVNFFRVCNKYFDFPDHFRSMLIQIGEELGANNKDPSVDWLSPQKKVDILKEFEAEDKRIAKTYLKRNDGILFYDPMPRLDEKWNDPYEINGEDAIRSMLPIILRLYEEIEKLKKKK